MLPGLVEARGSLLHGESGGRTRTALPAPQLLRSGIRFIDVFAPGEFEAR